MPVELAASRVKTMGAIEWIRYSGSPKDEIIALRVELVNQGYDCIKIESSDVHCIEELYVPQYIALKPEIIKFKLAA